MTRQKVYETHLLSFRLLLLPFMPFEEVIKELFVVIAGDDGRLDDDDEILPLLSL